MLKIRVEQVTELHTLGSSVFENAMVEHARTTWPLVHAQLGDTELRHEIRAGIRRARGYGIRSEHGMACFLDFQIALGPRFECSASRPWARAILRSRHLDGDQKIERLWTWVEQELAEDASELS